MNSLSAYKIVKITFIKFSFEDAEFNGLNDSTLKNIDFVFYRFSHPYYQYIQKPDLTFY